MGKYSKVPWLRVYQHAHSPSAQTGWYVVYLFASDGTKIYLSLNQGTREIDGNNNNPKSSVYLQERVNKAREVIASRIGAFKTSIVPIDLGTDIGTAGNYDEGNVVSICYEKESIPDEAAIAADLTEMLDSLELLYEDELLAPTNEESAGNVKVSRSYDLGWLQSKCLWDMGALRELASTFDTRRPQLILAGPPGTGKTWIAENLALHLADGDASRIYTVQFHPSYSYEDFVEGLRPRNNEDGQLVFEPAAGPLLKAAGHASRTSQRVVLVIDELSRTNLSSVFGELFYLLEYRERKIDLRHSSGFELPANLCLIGTMNTVDRNIRSIDLALRRRFDVIQCAPRGELLDRYYSQPENHTSVAQLSDGLERLNADLEQELDRHHTIGHSYFMHPRFDSEQLRLTWERQIQPLLEEYFLLDPEKLGAFVLGKYWAYDRT